MTLKELRASLERRAAEAEAEGAQAPVARVYRLVLTDLEHVEANGGHGDRPPVPERLLTAGEVAARLGVPVKYVYRHAHGWPFTRRLSPKTLRFSATGLDRWQERAR